MGHIPKHFRDGISNVKIGTCELCGRYASLRPAKLKEGTSYRVIWACGICIGSEEKNTKTTINYSKDKY